MNMFHSDTLKFYFRCIKNDVSSHEIIVLYLTFHDKCVLLELDLKSTVSFSTSTNTVRMHISNARNH